MSYSAQILAHLTKYRTTFLLIGLVANVYPADKLVEECMKKAEKIASQSHIAAKMAKEAVNKGAVLKLLLIKYILHVFCCYI